VTSEECTSSASPDSPEARRASRFPRLRDDAVAAVEVRQVLGHRVGDVFVDVRARVREVEAVAGQLGLRRVLGVLDEQRLGLLEALGLAAARLLDRQVRRVGASDVEVGRAGLVAHRRAADGSRLGGGERLLLGLDVAGAGRLRRSGRGIVGADDDVVALLVAVRRSSWSP
jgi:hypothetical protein